MPSFAWRTPTTQTLPQVPGTFRTKANYITSSALLTEIGLAVRFHHVFTLLVINCHADTTSKKMRPAPVAT